MTGNHGRLGVKPLGKCSAMISLALSDEDEPPDERRYVSMALLGRWCLMSSGALVTALVNLQGNVRVQQYPSMRQNIAKVASVWSAPPNTIDGLSGAPAGSRRSRVGPQSRCVKPSGEAAKPVSVLSACLSRQFSIF